MKKRHKPLFLIVEKKQKLYEISVSKEEYYVNQVGKPLKISAVGKDIKDYLEVVELWSRTYSGK